LEQRLYVVLLWTSFLSWSWAAVSVVALLLGLIDVIIRHGQSWNLWAHSFTQSSSKWQFSLLHNSHRQGGMSHGKYK
jgi:hypothetical protein